MVNFLDDDFRPSIKARRYAGNRPPLGPICEPGLRRALIGWTHRDDRVRRFGHGQVWGWVTSQGHFHCYISEENRGQIPGQRYDTGHTNFSVIRMFHPYWCRHGIPKDGNGQDKKHVRNLYRELLEEADAHAVEDSGDDDDEEDNDSDGDAAARRDGLAHTQSGRQGQRNRAWHRAEARRHKEAQDTGPGYRISKDEKKELAERIADRHERFANRSRAKRGMALRNKALKMKRQRAARDGGQGVQKRPQQTQSRQATTSVTKQSPLTDRSSPSPPTTRARPVRHVPRYDITEDSDEDFDVGSSSNSPQRPGRLAPRPNHRRVLQDDDDDYDIEQPGPIADDADDAEIALASQVANGAALPQLPRNSIDREQIFSQLGRKDDGHALFIPESPRRDEDAFTDGMQTPRQSPEPDYPEYREGPSNSRAVSIPDSQDGGAKIKDETSDLKPNRVDLDQRMIDLDLVDWTDTVEDDDDELQVLGGGTLPKTQRFNPYHDYILRKNRAKGLGTRDEPMDLCDD